MLSRFFPIPRRSKSDVLHTNVYWECYRIILKDYMYLFHCLRYRAVGNIPQHGPIIFAPNHVSYYDPPTVAAGIPFRVRFMAWDKLFNVPLLGAQMRSVGAYPVKLQSADKGAIESTLKILRNNECVMIFPEGGRSEFGQLMPLEKGVARMAMQTGATIVPVTITGMFEAWPRHNMLPRLFRPIQIKYHAPLTCQKAENREQLLEGIERVNAYITRVIGRRLRAYDKIKASKEKRSG